ncbi:hypothetical protein Cgig2_018224 [Carnegiea gigantea]|uniref:Ribosomal protein S21 n=1 Tax=Carnegiea gigantea TaxID=171969 RepID=A0A9Q1QTC7_9CARY|nr:hypothetical protein Cgig2_018224 [Carnegiea gigantea]
MNSAASQMTSLLKRPSTAYTVASSSLQQWRGIRVKVINGNLEQALTFMQRKMTSSGIERMIKTEQTHHIKNSEKRVLARKALQRKLQSQDLARKLKHILIKKVRITGPIEAIWKELLAGAWNIQPSLFGVRFADQNFFRYQTSYVNVVVIISAHRSSSNLYYQNERIN